MDREEDKQSLPAGVECSHAIELSFFTLGIAIFPEPVESYPTTNEAEFLTFDQSLGMGQGKPKGKSRSRVGAGLLHYSYIFKMERGPQGVGLEFIIPHGIGNGLNF